MCKFYIVIKAKKFCMYFQYLERNNIKEFGRENFSFNTRVKVGQFFEGQAGTAVSSKYIRNTWRIFYFLIDLVLFMVIKLLKRNNVSKFFHKPLLNIQIILL